MDMEPKVASRVAEPPASRRQVLAWAPLVLLLVLGAAAALGLRVEGPAAAAPSGTVNVQAEIGPELIVNMSSCAAINAWTGGTLAYTDGLQQSTSSCTVAFGTTNVANGANLVIRDANTLGAGDHFFCRSLDGAGDPVTHDCSANQFYAPPSPVPSTDAQLEGASGSIGIRVGAAASGAVADWNTGGSRWYRVPRRVDSDTPCHTTGPSGTLGTCTFVLGANTDAAQLDGTYTGTIEFTATQRP